MVVHGVYGGCVFDDDYVSSACGGPTNVVDDSVACCEYVEGSSEVDTVVHFGELSCDGVSSRPVG